mgnify:CR=1 FL=1
MTAGDLTRRAEPQGRDETAQLLQALETRSRPEELAAPEALLERIRAQG